MVTSIWSIDSIHRTRPFVHRSRVYYWVRLVHYVEKGAGGLLYVLISGEGLDTSGAAQRDRGKSELFYYGRAFELDRDKTKRIAGKRRFKGVAINNPIFENKHLGDVTKRRFDIEERMKTSIRRYFREAPKVGGGEGTSRLEGGGGPDRVSVRPQARVFVFNVGQGDTIIVNLPGGVFWLNDAFFRNVDNYTVFRNWFNENRRDSGVLTRLILSHLHFDHIKSASKIINEFEPSEVITTDTIEHTTATVTNLLAMCHSKGILRVIDRPELIDFGGLEVKLIRTADFPGNPRLNDDVNEHGVVMVIRTNESIALLPGDVPAKLLARLVSDGYFEGEAINYRFYKVTHHGSESGCDSVCRTTSGNSFCDLFQPNDATTSCALNNNFGHPAQYPRECLENAVHSCPSRPDSGFHRFTFSERDNPLPPIIIS